MSGWEEAKKSRKVSDISSKWPTSYDEDDGGKKSKLTLRQTVIFNSMTLQYGPHIINGFAMFRSQIFAAKPQSMDSNILLNHNSTGQNGFTGF